MSTYQDSLLDLPKAGVYEVTVTESCIVYLGGVFRTFHLEPGTHYLHSPIPRNRMFVNKPIAIDGEYVGHP